MIAPNPLAAAREHLAELKETTMMPSTAGVWATFGTTATTILYAFAAGVATGWWLASLH
jgi:hypothetical protein